jgi:hypothetical protein
MNVVGFGRGTKSMMSLWLLNPNSLARFFCLLRLTKKKTNPTVQASRTQAPETDPAMIGVLAFCLDHNGIQHVSGVLEPGMRRSQSKRVGYTYPWRAATSEGFSDRAAYWIGVPAITVVVKDKVTFRLRNVLPLPSPTPVPQTDTGGSPQALPRHLSRPRIFYAFATSNSQKVYPRINCSIIGITDITEPPRNTVPELRLLTGKPKIEIAARRHPFMSEGSRGRQEPISQFEA